jgi:alpha-D-ribose 1-methylphosphonate 5-triphosphate synthase subunit PhnL
MGTILSVRGLSKTIELHILGGKTVTPFNDVSFDVLPGELVAIVGASGSGKSSVVKAIHRTYLTNAGEIYYETADRAVVDLARLPDPELVELRRREIGYVSQFLRAEPRIPALEVVAMPLLRRGVPREQAMMRASELLDHLALPGDLWSSYPTLFSGGEQQRVGIARALCSEPRLLLADEPTSALDGPNVARVVEAFARVLRTGTTIVGVFHDVNLVRRLADRVVLLERGRVTAVGRPEDVEIPVADPLQELAPRI